ncbi:MAG: hypothetical protein GY755_12995, partial [Chloroflexi bacterium]|nr:hypothetical protein [Chloroflexota bacterium]
YKIINLNYICECIRNNNNIIKTGISFVLIYCSELYRLQISNANEQRKLGLYNKLKYERQGFNSILNTLHILHKNKNKNKNEFCELMKCINDETNWLKNKI